MTTHKRSFVTQLWDFFCSLKLSIFLLIALAGTSIIGTIIPQVPLPEAYVNSISSLKLNIYSKLSFFDMYRSWWFMSLLLLLTMNLIACSIKRLPRVWKMIVEPTFIMDDGLEKSLSLTHDFKMAGEPESVKSKVVDFLKREFASPVETEVNGEYHLFAQKNPYARLGVYVVHFSIIIIFIGAMLGYFFGYKGYVNIVEGTSATDVDLYRAPATIKVKNALAGLLGAEKESESRMVLPFSVRCEKFSVSFYETGAPKEFKSILSIIDNGVPVIENRAIVVNSPLSYKGITFYQSSYGAASDGSGVYHLTVRNKNDGNSQPLTLRQGQPVPLPSGGMVQVVEATSEVSRFIPGFSGPAAKLEVVTPGKQPESFIVFQNYPEFDQQRGGSLVFTYKGADEKMYTGLQVAKDPGVWVVWSGCALMVIGIFMAFFLSHQRLWVRVAKGRVTIGGTASKNPAGFQLLFENLTDKMKNI